MSIPVSHPQTRLTAEATARARNARRVSWIILGAAVVLFVYNLYTAILDPVWQQFAIVGVSVMMGLASVVSVWLVRRDRFDPGVWFAVGGVLLVCLAGALLFQGLGLLLSLGAVILTSLIAGQSLSSRQATRATVASVGVGILALLVDMSEPAWRISAVSPTTATAIMVALVLIYGVFGVRQFANYTLRAKLIIAFLAVSLIPLGLMFYLNDRTASATTTANVGANLKSLADSKALAIGDQLAQQVNMLRLLNTNKSLEYGVKASEAAYAGDPATIQALLERLDQQWRAADAADNNADPLVQARLNNDIAIELREYSRIVPGNVQVFVTDHYGALVAATHRTSDYYQADESWWQTAWNNGQGAVYIGQPEFDWSSAKFSVIIAVPLYSTARSVIGVLCTNYEFEALTRLLVSVRLGRTGRAEIYSPGRQLYTAEGVLTPDDPKALSKLRAVTGDYAELDYRGKPSLMSVVPVASTTHDPAIANLGWLLVVSQDRAEGLAPLQAQTRSALLLALVIAVAVTLAAVGGAQALAGPITRLTAVAERVTVGDLTAQAAVEAHDEVGTLASTFNTMVAQLRQTLAGLEQRVAERTIELERRATQIATGAEVARAATTAMDPEQLMAQAVELMQERFGYYYVGLFLVDAHNRYAVLQAGSGEAGRIMKERDHRLEVGGKSMVGWVCNTGQARIALDVGGEPVRFDNPLLPETRSEMALPLRAAGRTIGALDVQSTQASAFDQSDVAALQGMADQIAVALGNARLFQQTQRALQELDEANRLLVRQGWQEYLTAGEGERQAEFSSVGVRTMETSGSILRIPVELRGQSIGTLVMERGEEGLFWTDDEAQAIRAIVQQAALALDSARLLEGTQQRAQREQLSAQITTKMRAAPDVPSILRTSLHEVRRALGATHGVIRLEKPVAPREEKAEALTTPVVPIQLRGQRIGAIDLSETLSEHQWTEDDVTLVTTIADQVAIALENARLFNETQRTLEETRALYQTSRQITTAGEMNQVLSAVLDNLARTGIHAAAVALFDAPTREQAKHIELAGAWDHTGTPRLAPGVRFAIADFPMFSRITSERALVSSDLLADPLIDDMAKMVLGGLGLRAMSITPLLARGQWIGVLFALVEQPHTFTQAEIDFQRALADQAAVAIDSRRLFAQVQRRAEREALLRQITTRIRAAGDVQSVLETTAAELARSMGVSRAIVRLTTGDDGRTE